jgi:RNA polymerase sigma-70 factor (ECF subfamily)
VADERSDEQLMHAYVEGDEAAFRELYQRYGPLLTRLVRRKVRTDGEADDIVQQAMLHMHRARRDFRPDSRLRPWLLTIAMNLVREHYRRRGRRPEHLTDIHNAPIATGRPGPNEQLEASRRGERVRAAIARLPASQREVIELHWLADSPYEEVANVVGASVGAVRVRAHRGYLRLRELLETDEEA